MGDIVEEQVKVMILNSVPESARLILKDRSVIPAKQLWATLFLLVGAEEVCIYKYLYVYKYPEKIMNTKN